MIFSVALQGIIRRLHAAQKACRLTAVMPDYAIYCRQGMAQQSDIFCFVQYLFCEHRQKMQDGTSI